MLETNRKILFFDIDGTLITDDGEHYFPESAKTAIRDARKNGHLVFINTGRVFCNVTENIRNAVCEGVVEKCREYKMYAVFEHAEKVFTDAMFLENESLRNLIGYFKENSTYMEASAPENDGIFDKFCAWYDEDNPNRDAFRAYLEKEFTYIQREGNFCEVVPKGFSKASGIQYLLDYFDIPLSQAYAFGDGSNDEPMLAYVPNSIIMKKGPEYLKRQVRFVTDDVRDDGIYKAMKKMEII